MTLLSNALSSVDKHLFRPLVQQPLEDLMQAATIKVDDDGKPVNLDSDGNQDGFHPFGAVFTASVIAAAVFKFTHLITRIAIPYCLRSHVILATKISVGSSLFHLTGTALRSIEKQSAARP